MSQPVLTRRALAAGVAAAGSAIATRSWAAPSQAAAGAPKVFDLTLEHRMVDITGTPRPAMAINGQIPGPALRFREGEAVILNVTNHLREDTSLHWHGLLLPSGQDGVPGVSDGFWGIPAGTTHQYRFPLRQSGTYWYHSHSATQEQAGLYGPIIIEPARPDPFAYDRDYIVELSDWTDEVPDQVIANLKRDPSYYNYQRRTAVSLLRELTAAKDGAARAALIKDRMTWGDMRMDPTDIEDVTGFTFLVNGRSADRNYTALFRPGERVRLRIINSSAMTFQDVRIPGLRMTVVQADGQNVEPVTVDEFRIAPAETLDVIVTPPDDRQYQVLGESMGRQGFARMTLATRAGLPPLPLPAHRPRPLLDMADMGSSFGATGADRGTPRPEHDQPGQVAPIATGAMGGMAMGGAKPDAGSPAKPAAGAKMDMGAMGDGGMKGMDMPGMDMGNAEQPSAVGGMAGMGDMTADPFTHDTGAPPGAKVLSYRDLKALHNPWGTRAPDRVIEVRLTGNMERYFWSINANQYSDAQPIIFHYGERVRLHFINETMMTHPMHLHGMWMVPDAGNGARNPLKHVVVIKPGAQMNVDVVADAEGGWAFHCHMLYHMETGMMRKVIVQRLSAGL